MLSERLLDGLLKRVIREGRLSVVFPSGRTETYGRQETPDGEDHAPACFAIKNAGVIRRLLINPAYAFPDAYVKGDIRMTRGSVYDVIAVSYRNGRRYRATMGGRIGAVIDKSARALAGANSIPKAGRNARRHYDMDERFYRLFLDDDMQYSCAYFERPEMTLEEAQEVKKRRLISKLNLHDGARVLDIGCGWGGLALSIARARPDARVTGVTLSPHQLEGARRRAKEAGLSHRVDFQLKDYREIEGPFDRIVSVGMFEHVGPRDYGAFFDRVRSLLAPEGLALIHTIGRAGPPGETSLWIRKNIFPGGHIPALSEIAPAVEKTGLVTGDVETLRLHYAQTLRCWRERFHRNLAAARRLYGEEFCRMWTFYLAGAEASFRHLDHVVYQIQLLKSLSAAPITRDYMTPDAAPVGREDVAA